jgi:hypothetical protein
MNLDRYQFCGEFTIECANLASAFGIRNLLPNLRLLLTQSYPITEIMLQLILLLLRQAVHLTCADDLVPIVSIIHHIFPNRTKETACR